MCNEDGNRDVADAQHGLINQGRDTEGAASFKRTTHPEAQWFPDAGLGLFIHWDIGSVEAMDIGWSMVANTPWDQPKITPEHYWSLAETFDPDAFDPDRMLQAAGTAGFRYAVLTTKHHAGYTLWPSEYGDLGVKRYLPGRDFVKQFVQACRRHQMKVGLYYSPPDWYFNREYMSFNFASRTDEYPDRPHYNTRHEEVESIPIMPAEHAKAHHEYIRGQVTELLTGYGRIDLLWFDGGPAAMSIAEIRSMQPHIVVNPRMHGYGDLETPENHHPDDRPTGWWERCDRWNHGGWGYSGPGYRPIGWLQNCLAQARSWGGSLLANAAPDGTGAVSEDYYTKLAELKAWMAHSAESVFGVEPGPWPLQCSVPVTTKGRTWYVHVNADVEDAELTGVQRPSKVVLQRTGQEVPFEYTGDVMTVRIPDGLRTALDDVVAVTW